MSGELKDDFQKPPRARLNSWKEIAAYLDKDLSFRTAQRWEAEGLPVYREGVRVFAYTDELDRWKLARIVGPSIASSAEFVG